MKKILSIIICLSILFPSVSSASVLGVATKSDIVNLQQQIITIAKQVIEIYNKVIGGKLGAAITQTQLTDTIGTFRTQSNANFVALNEALTASTSSDPGHTHSVTSSITGTVDTQILVGALRGASSSRTFTYSSSTDELTATLRSASSTITTLTLTTCNGCPTGKFGGSGADGALSISAGTTTVSLGKQQLKILNYSSISITGTGALAFNSTTTNGTIVVLKSQGACTLTSSNLAMIDVTKIGGVGGATGAPSAGANGGSGGGGASAVQSGQDGKQNSGSGGFGNVGSNGSGFGPWPTYQMAYNTNNGSSLFPNASTTLNGMTGGQGAPASALSAQGGASPLINSSSSQFIKVNVLPGSGGGGGSGSDTPANGPGGAGAGGLYMECAGALNFATGGIDAHGQPGSGAGAGQAGAGGGGGGSVVILYGSLTANTGSFNVAGGAGGSGTKTGGAGANGFSFVAANTEW